MRNMKQTVTRFTRMILLVVFLVILGAAAAWAADPMDVGYSVILDDAGETRVPVITSLRKIMNIGIKDAKEIVENVGVNNPYVVLGGVDYDKAVQALSDLTHKFDLEKNAFTNELNGASGHIRIDRANVNGFAAPARNDIPSELNKKIVTPKSCGYEILDVTWMDTVRNNQVSPSNPLTAGIRYKCFIRLKAKEGFLFNKSFIGYLGSLTNNVESTCLQSDKVVEIETKEVGIEGTLTKMVVTNLTEPKVGAKFDSYIRHEYNVSAADGGWSWYKAKASLDQSKLSDYTYDIWAHAENDASQIFAEGNTYVFVMQLAYTSLVKLDEASFKPTINGKPAVYCWKPIKDGHELNLFYVVDLSKKQEDTQPSDQKPSEAGKPAAVGTKIVDESTGCSYSVISADEKAPEVAFVKAPAQNAEAPVEVVEVPAVISAKGVTYKVTSIAQKAFRYNMDLTRVIIGKNVKTIGAQAFNGCLELKTVVGGKGIVTIGAQAFKNCRSLEKFVLYGKVQNIGKRAFNGCKGLKSLKIKSKLLTKQSVHKTAFKQSSKNVQVTAPKKKAAEYKAIIKF